MRRRLVLLLIVLAVAGRASAQIFATGVARVPGPGAACDAPLGPSSGELFITPMGRGGEEPSPLLASIDGLVDPVRVDWDEATGAWFVTEPTGALSTAAPYTLYTITAWPDPSIVPMTEHRGLLLLDADESIDGWLQLDVAQEIPTPIARVGPGGADVAWSPLASTPTPAPCSVGPGAPAPFVDHWNVYELGASVVTPGISTPDHYLCGADLDCSTTADNGFVGTVPNVPEADGLLHFRDAAGTGSGVYVVQPVKRGAPTGDSDSDGVPDEDINADGIPEFVDPAGVGRGLTARETIGATFRKPILISPDGVSLKDPMLFVREVGRATHEAAWDALGLVPPPPLDLHAGNLADIRDPVTFAARDRLACSLPDGPASIPLVDPVAGNRYYLLSAAAKSGSLWIEEFGHDSFGAERPATTTLPPCR